MDSPLVAGADWERVLGTNVKGYAWGIKHAGKVMMQRRSGEISRIYIDHVVSSDKCSLLLNAASKMATVFFALQYTTEPFAVYSQRLSVLQHSATAAMLGAL